jgi:alkanesulfonate monooxygenase
VLIDSSLSIRIFSTCPQSRDVESRRYPGLVADVARWSEAAGYEGILVYSDNGLLDPWVVSQLIIGATERLCPLVAVQPIYMHPYSVAKLISTFAALYERRIYLNMLAGGFRNDLLALGDDTAHDQRYERMVEYARIIAALVAGAGPVTVHGRHHRVENLRLAPPVAPALAPGWVVSGSSPAGLSAARELGAIAVRYPLPAAEEQVLAPDGTEAGIRVGIIAREDRETAWRAAYERFPEDRHGQIAHGLAMRVSDSHWHRRLSERADAAAAQDDLYWLGPLRNYKTFCPYLVGDYGSVAGELRRHLDLGVRMFILDIPASADELDHIAMAFAAAGAVGR